MGSTSLLNISVHNTKQKQLLYKYFIEGEETGKLSPKQAEQALHSKLTVEECVTVRQIKSLCSPAKNGKLTNPVNNAEDIAGDSIDHAQVQFKQQKIILDV